MAIIPILLIEENAFTGTFLMNPFKVSIMRYLSSENSLTGTTEVILSPSDNDNS